MPSTAAATKPRTPRARRPKDAEVGPPARIVDGRTVVEERPVMGGLPGRDGNGVPLRITELVLDDGTRKYGCVDCETSDDLRGQMMRHRAKAHGKTSRTKPSAGLPASVRAMTLDDLIELAVQADTAGETLARLTEEVLIERDRANTAEGKLRRLRAALNKAGFKLEVDA